MSVAVVAACVAAGSALVAVRGERGSTLARLAVVAEGTQGSRRPVRWLLVALALAGVAAAALVGGLREATLAAALALVGMTAAVQLRARSRERLRRATQAETARACVLVAAEVRAGRSPEGAVELVATDCGILGPAAAALAVGDDVVRLWREQSRRPGQSGLAALGRAWQVSRGCGAPMGPSLDQVAVALEREVEVAATVQGELAAAQATGRLMAVLPLVGIGLGYSIGGRPLDFLLESTAGLACTFASTILACGGVLWTSALSRSSGRSR